MNQNLYLPLAWLFIINIFGFVLCASDKRRAEKRRWRIPEKNLFLTALLGGSLGVYASMLLFRHKTRHMKFMAGIPLIFAVELGIFLFSAKQLGLL